MISAHWNKSLIRLERERKSQKTIQLCVTHFNSVPVLVVTREGELCVTLNGPSVWGLFLENPFLIIEQLPSAMNILETVNWGKYEALFYTRCTWIEFNNVIWGKQRGNYIMGFCSSLVFDMEFQWWIHEHKNIIIKMKRSFSKAILKWIVNDI